MSQPEDPNDRIIELLLAATPGFMLEALASLAPGARALLDANRELLAQLALGLEPVSPSAALRQRFAQAIASTPQAGARRAVLVLDMQRDYLTPGRPLEVPRARDIVPALRARLDEAHAKGEAVVYVCDRHEPGDPELDEWGTHNLADSEGAGIWPELAPREGDRIVQHRVFNGFQDSNLGDVLTELAVDTVVLTGCVAEIQIFVTGAEAMSRGYRVEVPPACIAGGSPVGEAVVVAALSAMRPVRPFAMAVR